MTRTLVLAAAAVTVVASTAAAQGGRHPLVGQWQVNCAGPTATSGAAESSRTATLTIAQDGNQLIATLETPSARNESASTTHRLRGVVVGDEAQFTFSAPTRVIQGRRSVLRDSQVRWMIGVRDGQLTGSQLRVLNSTSEMLAPTSLSGTRIDG